MHISDGVLSLPILGSGIGLTAVFTFWSLRRMKYSEIPVMAVMSSAFFTVSLIHVPIGPGSVHLIMNGLAGLLCGFGVFPVIFCGLLMQMLFFGYGGYMSIGVNTFNMAFPALLCFLLFGGLLRGKAGYFRVFATGFLCGFLSVAGAAFLVWAGLCFSNENLKAGASLLVSAHIPVMFSEGLICGFATVFIKRVKPLLFEVHDGEN